MQKPNSVRGRVWDKFPAHRTGADFDKFSLWRAGGRGGWRRSWRRNRKARRMGRRQATALSMNKFLDTMKARAAATGAIGGGGRGRCDPAV
jgi:hypothetical protein